MIEVGIDPGVSGAIAKFVDGRLAEVADMPLLTVRVKRKGKTVSRNRVDPLAFAALMHAWAPDRATVEQVHSMPTDGGVQAFSFGKGTGLVLGVLAGCGVPVVEVPPQTWKASMRVKADKTTSRARARELWPALASSFKLVKHDGRAEAALIGEWRRVASGDAMRPIEW